MSKNLNPDLREILSMASVEGGIFTAEIIAQILKDDERTSLHKLSTELESKFRLIREVGEFETSEGLMIRFADHVTGFG